MAVNSSRAGNCNFCAVLLRVEPHMHAHTHEHTHAGLLTPGKEEEERITVGNVMCPWHTQDSARPMCPMEYIACFKERRVGGNPETPRIESWGKEMVACSGDGEGGGF